MDSCENGLTFGAPTEKEVILAELISELIPSMEVSRLVSSGTEAVMSAIRGSPEDLPGRDKDRYISAVAIRDIPTVLLVKARIGSTYNICPRIVLGVPKAGI